MKQSMTPVDDRLLWDLHLSALTLPSIGVALETGLFDALAEAPASAADLAERKGLNRRAVSMLLPMLVSAGLVLQRDGKYHLTRLASACLVRGSPSYWGPVFIGMMRNVSNARDSLHRVLNAPDSTTHNLSQVDSLPDPSWAEDSQLVRASAEYLQANFLTSARVAAERLDLSGVKSLMDVGAGSGCFAIAFAEANPALRCTMMDLPGMCEVGMEFVARAGVGEQVKAVAVDMFREAWPRGHDALFFSNILHDWDFGTCAMLLAKAFEALSPGGQILLHEALLDDTHDGPAAVAAFSLYMLLGPKGQQFTTAELSGLLVAAGFRDVTVTPSHAYYAIVSATKPV